MLEFAFAAVVVTLATWAILDIYLYSALFGPVRRYAAVLEQSTVRWKAILGYGLDCPYCLGHWVAVGLVLAAALLPNSFAPQITLLDGVFLVALAARLSAMLRENVLRPLSGDLDPEHVSDGDDPTNS